MTAMFKNASSFTSNLTDWCVEKITTEPEDFATGSQVVESEYPNWGQPC